MGLFDSFRRKKKKELPKPKAVGVKAGQQVGADVGGFTSATTKPDAAELLQKRAQLYERREQLQQERESLTTQLDNGEMTAVEFRKELMARIQEASQVSESIREIEGQLSARGHRVFGR